MKKRVMSIVMAGLLGISAVTGCSTGNGTEEVSEETKYISIATSSSGGAFSIIGTAMADIINKNVSGISANIEITGGSSENIFLAQNESVELAMTASDVLSLALNGEGSFEGKQVPAGELMGVMGGHLTTLQVYVLKDSDIHSYADLEGKKIAVGPAGSVAGDAMKTIMDAYGFEINKDWTPEYLAHGDGAEALTDGNVDAVCIMSTVPASPVSTAAASKEIRLLDIDQEQYDKIIEECSYYIPATVPANIYNGQDEAVERTFGSASVMVANKNVPEDEIYEIVKALYENNDALVAAYPQCNEWSVENAARGLEGLVEMHPGVQKYLEEIGK